MLAGLSKTCKDLPTLYMGEGDRKNSLQINFHDFKMFSDKKPKISLEFKISFSELEQSEIFCSLCT